MKKLLSLLVFALFAITASAQITWNAKVGGGISTCIYSEGADWDNKIHPVGKIGVGMEYPLSSNFSLMPSAEIAYKGAKWGYDHSFVIEDIPFEGHLRTVIDIFYFQIPVLGAYRFNLSDHMNLVAKAGPYFAFGFAGNVKNSEDSFNVSNGVFSEEVGGKRFEVGLDFGIDFEFKRYVVGAEYEFGLTPIVKEYGESVRNSAIYVTVGYKF